MGQWTKPPGSTQSGTAPPGVPPPPVEGPGEPPRHQGQWQPPYPIYGAPDPIYLTPKPQAPGPNGPATAALVCGIIALVAGVIPLLFFIAVPVGIVAIITGLVGLRRARFAHAGSSKAGTGLFTGVLGILAVVAWGLFFFTNEGLRAFVEQLRGIAEVPENVWSTLEPGDCLLDFTGFESITSIEPVPCDQPHTFEVFGRVEHPSTATEYPGLDSVLAEGLRHCEAPFAGYVGREYVDSAYFIDVLAPDSRSWSLGERRMICMLYDPDDLAITGSARGSGR